MMIVKNPRTGKDIQIVQLPNFGVAGSITTREQGLRGPKLEQRNYLAGDEKSTDYVIVPSSLRDRFTPFSSSSCITDLVSEDEQE